jgi:hypothetical protein
MNPRIDDMFGHQIDGRFGGLVYYFDQCPGQYDFLSKKAAGLSSRIRSSDYSQLRL